MATRWFLDGALPARRRTTLAELAGDGSVFVGFDGSIEINGAIALPGRGEVAPRVARLVDDHRVALGIGARVSLAPADVPGTARDGETVVWLRQLAVAGKAAVHRAGVGATVVGDEVRRLVVRVSSARVPRRPAITKDAADEHVRVRYEVGDLPAAELVVVDPAVVGGGGPVVLAWRYRFAGPDETVDILVDGSAPGDGPRAGRWRPMPAPTPAVPTTVAAANQGPPPATITTTPPATTVPGGDKDGPIGPDSIFIVPAGIDGVDIVPMPSFHVSDVTGVPDFVSFGPSGLHLPEAASGSATTVALAVFRRIPTMFATNDVARQFVVREILVDDGPKPYTHVVLEQRHCGIPVFGCEVRVHLSSALTVRSISGNYLRDPAVHVVPAIDSTEARALAAVAIASLRLATTTRQGAPLTKPESVTPIFGRLADAHPEGRRRPDVKIPNDEVREVEKARSQTRGRPQLVIVPGDFTDAASGTRLAWRMRFPEVDLFVDAHDRSLQLAVSNLHYVRQIYDADGQTQQANGSPRLVLRDSQPAGAISAGNTDVAPADAAVASVVRFWATLGRHHWNGAGADDNVVTNADMDSRNRAYWSEHARQMWFRPGVAGLPDVLGHEYTHAVISTSAKLVYLDEPGALNEHYADVMGELAGPDTPPTTWSLGGHNLANPAIDHYANYARRGLPCLAGALEPIADDGCDHGGVHDNSGIGNRAAVLLCDGDAATGHTGIGRARLGRLFADTLTTRLHPWARYLDELHNTIETANDLRVRGIQPAPLPPTTTPAPAFDQRTADEVPWAFTQVGVDTRLQGGWFSIGGIFEGRGTRSAHVGERMDAGFFVLDIEVVVRAQLTGAGYWEGRALVSQGGRIDYPHGLFWVDVTSHHIGSDRKDVTYDYFHANFASLEVSFNYIAGLVAAPTTPPGNVVLPTRVFRYTQLRVQSAFIFGGRGDHAYCLFSVLVGTGCRLMRIVLELYDRNGIIKAENEFGGPDATYGGTGARITTPILSPTHLAAGVHWWFDIGWACRYRLRYEIEVPQGGSFSIVGPL